MRYFSTRDTQKVHPTSLEVAILSGLARDGGLYMPESIPKLQNSFFEALPDMELTEVAYQVISAIVGEDIPEDILQSIVTHTFDFPIPIVPVASKSDQTKKDASVSSNSMTADVIEEATFHVIELFHGQTMAFKDVGARFMARMMGYFNATKEGDLNVIVATSGDTGGAVAAGFYGVPGVQVHILFPKGKVSRLQELQLTSWGGNIHAYRVDGTFDDCQALSKQALSDPEIRKIMRLTSANSINISRLIPQIVYYFWGAARWLAENECRLTSHPGVLVNKAESTMYVEDVSFTYSIPSGNFGNLTAGLFAKRMGLPIHRLIAATNDNSVLPEYLASGNYEPRRSVKTLSNAMDVGNPSNFERMVALFDGKLDRFREVLFGSHFSDSQVVEEIQATFNTSGYHLDPHTAVATLGMKHYLAAHPHSETTYTTEPTEARLVLATAHPIKFGEESDPLTSISSTIPKQAYAFYGKPSQAEDCSTSYKDVKQRILQHT